MSERTQEATLAWVKANYEVDDATASGIAEKLLVEDGPDRDGLITMFLDDEDERGEVEAMVDELLSGFNSNFPVEDAVEDPDEAPEPGNISVGEAEQVEDVGDGEEDGRDAPETEEAVEDAQPAQDEESDGEKQVDESEADGDDQQQDAPEPEPVQQKQKQESKAEKKATKPKAEKKESGGDDDVLGVKDLPLIHGMGWKQAKVLKALDEAGDTGIKLDTFRHVFFSLSFPRALVDARRDVVTTPSGRKQWGWVVTINETGKRALMEYAETHGPVDLNGLDL